MTIQSTKCTVSGCPGRVESDSNGNGAVNHICVACEKRARWKRINLPEMATVVCEICEGRFIVAARGAGRAKHCAACRPLAAQKQKNDSRARSQERGVPAPIALHREATA